MKQQDNVITVTPRKLYLMEFDCTIQFGRWHRQVGVCARDEDQARKSAHQVWRHIKPQNLKVREYQESDIAMPVFDSQMLN